MAKSPSRKNRIELSCRRPGKQKSIQNLQLGTTKQWVQRNLSEIKKYKIDIAVITETKKEGPGSEAMEGYIHYYSDIPKEHRAKAGVSILIKKQIARNIKSWNFITERIMSLDITIKALLRGDLNARTGCTENSAVVRRCEDHINDNGERLVNSCEEVNPKILNDFTNIKPFTNSPGFSQYLKLCQSSIISSVNNRRN